MRKVLTFKKELMKKRIEREGRISEWTEEVEKIANDLDGMPADTICWAAVVKDEPYAWCVGRSGDGHYVNLGDCV